MSRTWRFLAALTDAATADRRAPGSRPGAGSTPMPGGRGTGTRVGLVAAETAALAAPPALPGAVNMAVDQTLLETVQAGGPPVLRLYAWDPACLSLGRNQPAEAGLGARAAARRLDLVRRPTGGRAVLHDRELTYAVALPAGLLGSPRRTYTALNEGLAAGLRRLGIPARTAPQNGSGRPATRPGAPPLAPVRGPARPGSALLGPCFQAAAPGEIIAAGRKLVGSAQRCELRSILQHGSILLEGDQSAVAALLDGVSGTAGGPPATVSVVELLGYVPILAELVEALREGFREALGISLAPACLTPGEAERVRELERRFRSAAWTWRR